MSHKRRVLRFTLGMLLAVCALVALAEVYLRLYPPGDLHLYLGDQSPLKGIYKSDAEIAVTYKDWQAFYGDNAAKLDEYFPGALSPGSPPVWAFFGNSFAQAPRMLADHVRARVKDRVVFNLGRNEPVPVRFAQVKLLLDAGLRPERIFMVFLPVDTVALGQFPLKHHHVNAAGALTYSPYMPDGPLGCVIGSSRVAFTGWVRGGWHKGNWKYHPRRKYGKVEPVLLDDLRTLLTHLGRTARAKDVPVTVILIPEAPQVTGGAGFAIQDEVGQAARAAGCDVFDPRDAFRGHPDPRSLYIPDGHLSRAGNQLLWERLAVHLQAQRPPVEFVLKKAGSL